MIRAVATLFAIVLTVHSQQQQQQSTPISPCPNVFNYEPPGTEPGRWYGVVSLSTDSTLHSVWLNIVLDNKADILGNWVGDVTTQDNTDFKIENTKMKIHPGPAVAVRFFVQYNPLNPTPRLQAIRLNGREICNANNPLPAVDRPESDSRIVTSTTRIPPVRSPDRSPDRNQGQDRNQGSLSNQNNGIRPEDMVHTRPTQGTVAPIGEGPVYQRPPSPPNPSSITGGGTGNENSLNNRPSRPDTNFRFTTSTHRTTTTTRRYQEDDDGGDYFEGGQPIFIVPSTGSSGVKPTQTSWNQNKRGQNQCGKVVRNNPNPLVVNGKPTQEGQWPWQIALYQTQTVDNKYICGGTLVSHDHIITAAHCVTRKSSNRVVNPNTLTVYLGKHNLRTSVEGVQIRLVGDIIVHPQYNASSYSRDLSILKLREPVSYTDFVRPACLWPESEVDLTNVIGKKGSVVGWGFDDTGVATEELSLVEMPVVDQETCIRSYSEFFVRFTSEYTYCAGFRDGDFDRRTGTKKSTSVCNGDSGGGMVFNIEGTWYLRGLVSLSVARQNEYRCDPTHYVVFTDLAKFLPWIKSKISDA